MTTEVTLDIPIPKAMGAWNATSTPDSTVYIGAYNYADPGVNGHLYSYTPGADQVVDLGEPVPGDGFLYGVTGAPDGSVYGGSFPPAGCEIHTWQGIQPDRPAADPARHPIRPQHRLRPDHRHRLRRHRRELAHRGLPRGRRG